MNEITKIENPLKSGRVLTVLITAKSLMEEISVVQTTLGFAQECAQRYQCVTCFIEPILLQDKK